MHTTQIPVGSVKTFGAYGIPYQVGERVKTLADGDVLVAITLLHSGEKELYKLSKLLQDPDVE